MQAQTFSSFLSRNSFTSGGWVPGTCPQPPSPLGPCGVTYTFPVTRRGAWIVWLPASLLQHVRTDRGQVGLAAPLPAAVSIARQNSPWHPASDLSGLSGASVSDTSHSSESQMTGAGPHFPDAVQMSCQPQPGCNNTAGSAACPPCLSLCLLILPDSNTPANVKWHHRTSAGDHTINPGICLFVTSVGERDRAPMTNYVKYLAH